ncbi:hypothetical protein BTVI_07750 [Pitangus sulphuratus]|nr:hypothetical protein BTVI_07750 [Pitangus sulphuratus]
MQTQEKEAERSSRDPPVSCEDCHSGTDIQTTDCGKGNPGVDIHMEDPMPYPDGYPRWVLTVPPGQPGVRLIKNPISSSPEEISVIESVP